MSHKNLKYKTLFCAAFILLLCAAGSCNFFAASKTEEIKSGRLKFVKTLRYGNVGTHGSQGWYVSNQNFHVNDTKWSPEGIDVNDAIANCEADPNEAIEALKCYSFANSKETVYLLRMTGDQPDWATANGDDYMKGRGNNLGEWVNDGKSLIFKDFIYTVQTGEKQEIKNAPGYPETHFRAVSTDLKTIVYQGDSFESYVEVSDEVKKNLDKIRADRQKPVKDRLEILWLIEASTGEIKLIELSPDKYDWLIWNQDKIRSRRDWLNFFQKHLVWEKDKNGKDQLVYPN